LPLPLAQGEAAVDGKLSSKPSQKDPMLFAWFRTIGIRFSSHPLSLLFIGGSLHIFHAFRLVV